MRRYIALPVIMLLSCSAITPVVAAGQHARPQPHGKHQGRTGKPPEPTQPVSAPVTQTANPPQNTNLPAGMLPTGLPASWQATVLDTLVSPPPPAPATGGATTTPPATAQKAPASTAAQPPTSVAAGPDQSAPSTSRILIPLPPDMGIAGFQSGNSFVIVVDNAEPMDTSALRGDGVFSTLTVSTLPDATLIQVRLPDNRQFYLSQQAEGWVLGDQLPPGNDYGDRRVINPRPTSDGLLYPMRHPGRVLSIKDPASGVPLLVGTSATDDGGILSPRKGDGYDVWPTTEGVVIAVKSPDIGMRATSEGALLSNSGKAISDNGAAVYASDVDLKWLGLRNLTDQALEKRFHNAIIAAADSEPAQHFARRLEAAQAAFSLGSFVEARGILTVALEDDPEEISRPDVKFLLAASELLSGNTDGASLLKGPWPDNQQRATQVWRGLYFIATGGHDAEAAHLLARDFTRLKNYPLPVSETILPTVAEEIGRYGSEEDLTALNEMPSGSPYQLATAFRELRMGKRDLAHTAFHKLATDKNPLVAEKALEQVTSLDLADGSISPAAAANALDSIIPDARLAGREATVRLLQADAYLQAGGWSDALAAIDRAQTAYPPALGSVATPLLFQTLAKIASAGAKETDKDNLLHDAAMLRPHVPELPPGTQKAEILLAYGKMLLSLGLPDEAAQAFSDAIPMLDSPPLRALAGEGLANADLERRQPQDATEALERTDDPTLSDDIKGDRRRLQARIALTNGNQAATLSLLKGDTNVASLDMSARIYEGEGQWGAATNEVRRMVETEIPQQGVLTKAQQALALRLASDATQADDLSTLDWIANRIGNRQMDDSGPVFNLLTKRDGEPLKVTSNSEFQ
ncbi:hypothetical protein [Komagataeibacter sp. FNDCR2]|uniref:hypothetical protein n=1 Tax=Komagataeibacter sp. FNDCR2 TaxID=2878682 RepID=UPI001E3CCAC5|nr:hypothetical protein [Komagataeibacter sp. FNDCR2]